MAQAGLLGNNGSLSRETTGMIGDVNLFLLSEDEAADYHELAEARLGPTSSGSEPSKPFRVAEIMIMIAEPSARRKGAAAEAARLMMEWGE